MNTSATIWPAIRDTYGDGSMARALAAHLAQRIDNWPDGQPNYGAEEREQMVMHVCWDWFSGGTTAESVAKRIEEALSTASGGRQ